MIMITSCNKDEETSSIIKEKVTGYAQKGPYINGTLITLSELSSDLLPTGRTFYSQILDNTGTFEIRDVNLKSQYVELIAQGFYFNEISNNLSPAQLTLFALTDLKDSSSINVNILTTLEKRRVEYLLSQGKSFEEAKIQAQQEILSIFTFNDHNINNSEFLDISQDSEGNAILLAISIILQGFRNVGELSELLSNFSTEISEDGVLNSDELGSDLINDSKYLNLTVIRSNLENKYEELGVDATIPNFEFYVTQFNDNSNFKFTDTIFYPEKMYNPVDDIYARNLLFNDTILEFTGTYKRIYALAMYVPYPGSIKIVERTVGIHFREPVSEHLFTYPSGSLEVTYKPTVNITDTTYLERTYISQISGDTIYTFLREGTGPLPANVFFDIYENGSSNIKRTVKIEIK
jgi:hypothetical protein